MQQGSKRQVFFSGAAAGLLSRFCTAPLDVIKIRLQLQVLARRRSNGHSAGRWLQSPPGSTYRGGISTAKEILLNEGIRAFWKGNIPAEMLYLFYGGIQFTLYRQALRRLQKTPSTSALPSAMLPLLAGSFAGGIATTVTYPLDLIRTRFAAQGPHRVYRSLRSCIHDIYRHEGGARGYFRGLGAGLNQIVPYMGVFFATYERLRPSLAALDLPYGSSDAMAAVVASVVAKTGVFPLDVVRKRMQVQGPTRTRYVYGASMPVYAGGPWRTLRAVLALEGPRGLYRGLGVSLFKAVPTSAITIWTFEQVLAATKALGV
ncbi:MAG: mitochondrial thiamine pyrophosphate transporter [Phylliscum demangeonii]|nr:MAG: mitochondrial thiamine pyrophosphate transporter [Phylliscum demangeonii]